MKNISSILLVDYNVPFKDLPKGKKEKLVAALAKKIYADPSKLNGYLKFANAAAPALTAAASSAIPPL